MVPGDRALRRLPRQRRRALEDPDARRAAGDPGDASAPTPRASCPTRAIPQTLARPWAIPGTPGLEHRIGGLEKQDGTGNVNYEPLNHERMVRLRAAKVEAHRPGHPRRGARGRSRGRPAARRLGLDLRRRSPRRSGRSASKGRRIGHVHLRHLNPLPQNLGDVLKRYSKVVVPEMNLGQLVWVLRAKYLVDAAGLQQGPGQAVQAVARSRPRSRRCCRVDDRDACPSTRRRTSRPTRRSAGARAAGTTRSSPPCSRCSRSWASRARSSWSSRGSAAPAASRTT